MNLGTNPRWQDQAACAGTPLNLWFNADAQPARNHEAAAIRTCWTCPVLGECGPWTVNAEYPSRERKHGIFAGLTSAQRSTHHHTINGMTPEQYEHWYWNEYAPTKWAEHRRGA